MRPLAETDRPLLGEDGVVGVALPYGVHHQFFAKEVHLGHEVLGGLLPHLARVLVARDLKLPSPAGTSQTNAWSSFEVSRASPILAAVL